MTHSYPFWRKTRPAFTLVELLVVFSIVGMLIALLLPAVSKAKETSRISVCLANQRQIATMLTLYHNDSVGFIPQVGSPHMIAAGSVQAGAALVIMSSGANGVACPYGGGVARAWPSGLGWLYWQGYLPPIPNYKSMGIILCPDMTNFRADQSYAHFNEVNYRSFSKVTAGLAQRTTTPTPFSSSQGGNWDCNPDYSTWGGYYFRGWMTRWDKIGSPNWEARVDRWRSTAAVLVDFERHNNPEYLDNHGDGLNVLFADGHAAFGGRDVNGKKPHVNATLKYTSYTEAQALSNGNSGVAYAVGANLVTTNRLWSYYETGNP